MDTYLVGTNPLSLA